MNKHIKALNKSYHKKTIQELTEYYDKWDTYEQDLMALGYFGPIGCTALLYKHVKPTSKILEVGCGPGNVGRHLQLMKFKNIYGLDASSGMVDRAIKENVYKKVYHHIVDKSDLPLKNIDVLLGVGVFTVGHFPTGSMKLCFDHVKTGGYFCFSGTTKVLNTIFKKEFSYVKKNSKLIDCTSAQNIVAHADSTHRFPARAYLFQRI